MARQSGAAYVPRTIGDTVRFEAHGQRFIVGYRSRGNYWLRTDPPGQRGRWGNRREIIEDIEHALEFGTLPPPSGEMWEGRRHRRASEDDREPPRIRISYSRVVWVDPEDPDGYEDEHGWIDEEGVEFEPDEYDIEEGMTPSESIVEQAAKFLKGEYATNPSSAPGFHPGIWYSTEYEVIDYGTGEEEERSFHLEGFTPEEEKAIWQEVTGRRR